MTNKQIAIIKKLLGISLKHYQYYCFGHPKYRKQKRDNENHTFEYSCAEIKKGKIFVHTWTVPEYCLVCEKIANG